MHDIETSKFYLPPPNSCSPPKKAKKEGKIGKNKEIHVKRDVKEGKRGAFLKKLL